MTALEAEVPAGRWSELTERFRGAGTRLPSQLLHAFLVQSATEPTRWRAISIWRSRAALEEYRRSVAVPAGIAMFRSLGAEPAVTVWAVGVALPDLAVA
jgi:hypothetical protein